MNYKAIYHNQESRASHLIYLVYNSCKISPD